MNDDKEGTIRDRAYAIWQEEGEPDGRDAEHWHRAASEQTPPVAPERADPTAGVDASGLPTEESAAAAPAAAEPVSTGDTDAASPLTKLKKKTAKIVKSL